MVDLDPVSTKMTFGARLPICLFIKAAEPTLIALIATIKAPRTITINIVSTDLIFLSLSESRGRMKICFLGFYASLLHFYDLNFLEHFS
jgi:hypothetical protein